MATSDAMDEYVTGKLEKLAKKFDWIINAVVYFKVEHDSKKQKGRVCKIELSVPGPRIFAESFEINYKKAVQNTIGDLETQLKKRKQTFQTY